MAYGDQRDTFADLMGGGMEGLVRAILALEGHAAPPLFPSDIGLLGWSCDPAQISSQSIPSAGVLQIVRVRVPASTIYNVHIGVQANGVALTAGQNFAGVFDTTGKLLSATADQTTAWGAGAPYMTVAPLLTPVPVAAGDVYVGFYANWVTTGPTFYRTGGVAIKVANMLQLGGLPFSSTVAAVAALPSATLQLASVAGLAAGPSWVLVETEKGPQIVWYQSITGSTLQACTGGVGTAQVGAKATTPGCRQALANSGLTTALPTQLASVTPTNTGGALWAAVS